MPRGATALAFTLVSAIAAQALAAGPVYVRRNELPRTIARLHTCVVPDGRTTMLPRPTRVGGAVLFVIACPLHAPDVATFAAQGDDAGGADDGFSSLAYYVAADASGRGVKRLVFLYPRPDGTEFKADALPVLLEPGWSAHAHTSAMTGAAFLDPQRQKFPPGAFMLMGEFAPADRPHRASVIAIWLITNGAASLIYWAETSERLRGEYPAWQYPRYEVVLDRRPER